MELKCTVNDIVLLRVPSVFRIIGSCGDYNIEMEMHEELVKPPKKGSLMEISISTSREKCLEYYFCGHGYVISNTKLNDVYRVVISLHGLLVVVKSSNPLAYNVMDRLYVGASFD